MNFESAGFATLVVLALVAYWLLHRHRLAQRWVLLAASVGFYAAIAPAALPVMAVATTANFLLGERLGPERPATRRWLFLGIGLNLGLLGLYKYYNFFRDTVDGVWSLSGGASDLPVLDIVLPVGLSFSCFQAISYLVDTHRGTGPRAKNLLDFALFQMLFFQLVMGPICRSSQLLPQIEAESAALPEAPSRAFGLIAIGLFKRMVLAAALSTHGVSDAFLAPDNYTASGLWLIMLGYTVQIYCDFSGYTDLMRGIALLFGFEIPENFRNPYAATSVTEFWKRWHMSFSGWLREYIYFPLGGSRDGRIGQYQNLIITMLVCGLWHGAAWGFIIWGGLHGVALVVHKQYTLWREARGGTKAPPSVGARLTGWSLTLLFVCLTRIFFASPDLDSAIAYFARLADWQAEGLGADRILLLGTALGLAWNFVGDRLLAGYERLTQPRAIWQQVAVFAAVLLLLTLIRPGAESPSAYFGF